jgi:Fe-S-cluster-containing dehydrogenase component
MTDALVRPDPRDPTETIDRRHFLAVTAASAALAAAAGCSPRTAPRGELVPYVRPPEQATPGIAQEYATAFSLGGAAVGLLVTARAGRPVKVEGNPDHPGSLGATDPFSQAALLGLYDPERSQATTHRGHPRPWESAFAALRGELVKGQANGGAGLRVLSGAVTSPTLAGLMGELLKKFPAAKWVQHEPAGRDSTYEGTRRAFGEPLEPVHDFARADIVVSLDADFLTCTPGTVRYQRDFADRRRARAGGNPTNRLYAVETDLTMTGANAEHRLAVKPSEVEAFARALAAELKVPGVPPAGPLSDAARAWLAPLAADLRAHWGRSLVAVGDTQPASLHALGHAINVTLGNVGHAVRFTGPVQHKPLGDTITQLAADMAAGAVETLVVLEANPVYDAPADLNFAAALKKVPFRLHLGLYADETAAACDWHLPAAHPLEAWGDGRGFDGTATLRQPLIVPLNAGRSAVELVAAMLTGSDRRGLELVRDHWRGERGNPANFDAYWQRAVQVGTIPDSAAKPKAVTLKPDWAAGDAAPAGGGIELHVRPDPTLWDGRFANNGWLQELPKPVTKITWGNAVFLSPATAKRLGVSQEPYPGGGGHGGANTDVVELTYRGRTIRGAAWVTPGHADDAVTVHLGHGRWHAGSVGNGVGFSAYLLRTADAPHGGGGVDIKKTGDRDAVACTQLHHALSDRDAVRHATAAELAATPKFFADPLDVAARKASVTGPDAGTEPDRRLVPLTLYPAWPYEGRKWGMSIDLSTCTGCSACVVACQAENNIPVVGKDQVLRGREMHWIRVDRYTNGTDEYMQPVPCQQCENAPCEVVCPVGATQHSAEGLNDMVYNRCVGTRYCSNNCPYKVRRFNFLTYADYSTESLRLLHNPEVTVRSRGVMEKCTYCVQRLRTGEIASERAAVPIPDGSVQTACQQACPSDAIRFGDLNDPAAEVNRWKAQPHDYSLLGDLNTRPRTTYLAAIRNPNPAMPATVAHAATAAGDS